MNNSELFGVFAAQILATTFEQFPVAVRIPREDMQSLVNARIDAESTQRQVSTLAGMLSLLADAGTLPADTAASARARLTNLEAELRTKEAEAKRVAAVLDGTVAALAAEGFIRDCESGHFQLTFKGLAHLNKRFEEGSIQGQESFADRIRSALSPTNFVGSLTSGTLVSLVGRAIGG